MLLMEYFPSRVAKCHISHMGVMHLTAVWGIPASQLDSQASEGLLGSGKHLSVFLYFGH